MLAGTLISGIMLAIFMANAGGAWDNAKKSFEQGVEINGKMEYKGSDAHVASVTGDTVGDPFKDTSGPSMNILIKLMSIVSLVIAPHIAANGVYSTENLEGHVVNQKVEVIVSEGVDYMTAEIVTVETVDGVEVETIEVIEGTKEVVLAKLEGRKENVRNISLTKKNIEVEVTHDSHEGHSH